MDEPTTTSVKGKCRTLLLTSLLCCYISAYFGMSVAGGYMPGTTGLNGIKSWIWAPKLMTDDRGRFQRALFPIFFPLFWLDLRFWHNDWTGSNGPYKVLKPPAWRLGIFRGNTKGMALRQIQQVSATIVTNTPETLRAEYRTEDLTSPVQVELRFDAGQVTNIHYYFQ